MRSLTATFTLFSFNQVEYIRDAVKGVLSQQAVNLKVIISDDNSTDGTWEVIKDEVKSYTGPHDLVVRKNYQNLGLIAHMNEVIRSIDTDIVIMSAGDDISMSHRTNVLLEAFYESPDIMLVHSSVTPLLDFDLTCTKQHCKEILNPPLIDINLINAAGSLGSYIGASGAFRTQVFSRFGDIMYEQVYEDLIFAFRASLLGKVKFVEEPLLYYRTGIGISSLGHIAHLRSTEKKIYLMSHASAVFSQRLRDLNCTDHPKKEMLTKLLIFKRSRSNLYVVYLKSKLSFLKEFRISNIRPWFAVLYDRLAIFKNQTS